MSETRQTPASNAGDAAIDLDHLRTWIGREVVREQHLAPFPAQALAGLLDRTEAPGEGDALPLAWHWLYFLDAPASAATGVDGHPRRGGFLPPVPLPRRMWAAGEMTLLRPMQLGRAARKTSIVESVELKRGQSGPLVFVTVAHRIEQDGAACISERQHLVYREAPAGPARLPPGEAAPADADWEQALQPDPVMLFRYSALSYNGHRIHYDRDYATQVEFYPALVVHGPLLATLLLELLAPECPQRPPQHFAFRAQRPAFDTDPLRLCGRTEGAGSRLWTRTPDGFVGMSATVRHG